ncbi:MAG: hypothetical protein ACKO0M_04420, partial [Cyanobium sp.]
MASSGSRPPGQNGERRALGFFSLGIGLLLFVLILIRGQQAAREGNQELRNDTYWVLVSPLVFSGFGLTMLLGPVRRRAGSRRPAVRSGPESRAARAAPVDDAIPQLQRQVESGERQRQQLQQTLAAAVAESEQQLTAVRGQLAHAEAVARTAEQDHQRIAAEAQARIGALELQLEQARQAHSHALTQLETLQSLSQSPPGADLDRARALQQRLDSLARSLEQELSQARQEQERGLAAQRQDLDLLQRDLQDRLAAAEQARQRGSGDCEALQHNLEALQERLRTLEAERQQLITSLEALRAERQQQAESAIDVSRSIRQEIEGLRSRFAHQEQTLAQALDQVLHQQTASIAQMRSAMQSALDALEASRSEQIARANAAASRLREMDQQIQQAQQDGSRRSQDVSRLLSQLEQDQGRRHIAVEQASERIDQIAGRLDEQIGRAREDAARALRSSQEIRERLEQLQQSGRAMGQGRPEPSSP